MKKALSILLILLPLFLMAQLTPVHFYRYQTRSNTTTLPYENATNLALSFQVLSGTTIDVDWGDGVKVTLPANLTNQTKSFGTPTTGVVTIYQADRVSRINALAAYNFWKFNIPVLQRATGAINIAFTGNVSGNISDIPQNVTTIALNGNGTVTGTGTDIRSNMVSFQVLSSNADIQTTDAQLQAKPSLVQFRVSGNSKHVGDIALLPANMTIVTLNNTTTPLHEISYSGRTWANNMRRVELLPAAGHGLTTAQVDLLLHDLAQKTWITEKILNIGGNNARRSFASDADVASLQAQGVTVTVNDPITYYVRPTGTTYGTGDGTSYANAWSGFPAINWSLVEGNRLAVCGVHSQQLTMTGTKAYIDFANVNESGSISCGDIINTGFGIYSSPKFYINSPTVIDAVVTCIHIEDSTGKLKNTVVNGCGNQGIQHYGTCVVEFENISGTDNVDETISAHDSATITVTGSGSFTNGDAGINIIANCNLTISGSYTFSGCNNDLWAANATTAGSCSITAIGLTMNNVLASNGAKVLLNNCNVSQATAQYVNPNTGYIEATNSVIDSLILTLAATVTLNNCRVNDMSSISANGIATITNSYIKPVGLFDVNGTLRAVRTFFDGVDCTDHTIDCNNGSTLKLQYCILKNAISAKYALSVRTGATVEALEALTIDGSSVGRGLNSQISLTIRNAIFTGLAQGVFSATSGQTVTLENCTLYNNTANTAGTGSTVQNDAVNSNPLFTNASANDYSLQVGSPLIGAGETLSSNVGFLSVNWGDVDTSPIIITKTLTVFNIGCF